MATPAAVAVAGAQGPTAMVRGGVVWGVKRTLLLGRELWASCIVESSPPPQRQFGPVGGGCSAVDCACK